MANSLAGHPMPALCGQACIQPPCTAVHLHAVQLGVFSQKDCPQEQSSQEPAQAWQTALARSLQDVCPPMCTQVQPQSSDFAS